MSNHSFNEKKYNSVFAAKLRFLMGKYEITNAALAKYITNTTGKSITRQAVGQWANGDTSPNLETVVVISHYFNTTTDFLLTDKQVETANMSLQEICEYCGFDETGIRNLARTRSIFHTVSLTSQCLGRNIDIVHEIIGEALRAGELRYIKKAVADRLIAERVYKIVPKENGEADISKTKEKYGSYDRSEIDSYTKDFSDCLNELGMEENKPENDIGYTLFKCKEKMNKILDVTSDEYFDRNYYHLYCDELVNALFEEPPDQEKIERIKKENRQFRTGA